MKHSINTFHLIVIKCRSFSTFVNTNVKGIVFKLESFFSVSTLVYTSSLDF